MAIIRRLPDLYTECDDWPWPGVASLSDQNLIEAAWLDHAICCAGCAAFGLCGRVREYAPGCAWAGSIDAATRRTATRGEGGDRLVPAVLWRHRPAGTR
jgi:hypothetical protein